MPRSIDGMLCPTVPDVARATAAAGTLGTMLDGRIRDCLTGNLDTYFKHWSGAPERGA
jgi:hypothetical protein